jgi:two-component system chemotaxis response regulator CheB
MVSENSLIQVLVVDDSAVVRQVLQAVLSREADMCVTVAADPLIAMRKMKEVRPQVIVLDLEMPRMDGLTFLGKVMTEDPIPTLICSSVAGSGTVAAMRALQEGAVGIIAKPKLGVGDFLHDSAVMLIDAVRSAAGARVDRQVTFAVPPISRPSDAKLSLPRGHLPSLPAEAGPIVAIGASTGGTDALARILSALPEDAPGIVVVQHMPEVFTLAFAKWLNSRCRITVKEAEDGDRISTGKAFIAPGNRHMSVCRMGPRLGIRISEGPLVSRHRPSVDMLFRSLAQIAGRQAMGVILTGMGDDGAEGLLEMRSAGAYTIAQDEATCVVFGMPREAIHRGAVHRILPLESIPAVVTEFGSRDMAFRVSDRILL